MKLRFSSKTFWSFLIVLLLPFLLFSAVSRGEEFQFPIPTIPSPHCRPPETNGLITQEIYSAAIKSTPLRRLYKKPERECPLDLTTLNFDASMIGVDFSKAHPELPISRKPILIFDFCNLRGWDFNRLSLSPFPSPPLRFLRFIGANLSTTNFEDLTLIGMDFLGSNLEKSNFTDTNIQFSRFRSASLKQASFTRATFKKCKIVKCLMDGANFEESLFIECQIDAVLYWVLQSKPGVIMRNCSICEK